MKIRILALGLLLAAAAPSFAADIDGKWTGSIDTPNGAITLNYTFKAEGATLTGTLIGPDGATIPIKDGKIDKDKISFSLTLDVGGPTIFNYTGVVSPTELKLHSDYMGMPIDYALKKA